MKILCIIPARGGSKRIPNKNIILLFGKPLITYTIEHAKDSIFWFNKDGDFVDVNETVCRELQYSKKEILKFK